MNSNQVAKLTSVDKLGMEIFCLSVAFLKKCGVFKGIFGMVDVDSYPVITRLTSSTACRCKGVSGSLESTLGLVFKGISFVF